MSITNSDILIFVVVCIVAFAMGCIFGGSEVKIDSKKRYNDRKGTENSEQDKK